MDTNPYESPPEPQPDPPEEPSEEHRSFRLTRDKLVVGASSTTTLRSAFIVAILIQVASVFFTGMILDGSRVTLLALCGIIFGIIGYWCIIPVIIVRRWKQPTDTDLLFIKHGIWLIYLLMPLIITAVEWIRPLFDR